jgi:hypothetical protein
LPAEVDLQTCSDLAYGQTSEDFELELGAKLHEKQEWIDRWRHYFHRLRAGSPMVPEGAPPMAMAA